MQNVSGIKKWNYEKLPLNFAMQFPFPFPIIPGNNNVSFPFPKCGGGISIPVPKNWEWNFPVPVPKSWEWNFSFPFPFPKFGNGLSHSRSRSQMTKSHSRSPLPYYSLRSKVSKGPSLSEWSLTVFSAIEFKKVKYWVSERVSEWQGHVLSCRVTAKNQNKTHDKAC